MEKELILLSEYCENNCIEFEFISLLEDESLIEIEVHDSIRYIQYSQLNDLEMFKRLYYDLSINIEGIDVINNLLVRIRKMQKELAVLRRQSNDDTFFNEEIIEII